MNPNGYCYVQIRFNFFGFFNFTFHSPLERKSPDDWKRLIPVRRVTDTSKIDHVIIITDDYMINHNKRVYLSTVPWRGRVTHRKRPKKAVGPKEVKTYFYC